ncbi:hypothetical protein [Actinocorallia libanotica]|uniref:Uncharacterized protein n=1 Tax=Actinocorallia libanotica TaxID=46162 RepID=A0ABP4APX9_9ACTN
MKSQPIDLASLAEAPLDGVLLELSRVRPGENGQVLALAALAITRALQDVACAVRENAADEVVVRIAAAAGQER